MKKKLLNQQITSNSKKQINSNISLSLEKLTSTNQLNNNENNKNMMFLVNDTNSETYKNLVQIESSQQLKKQKNDSILPSNYNELNENIEHNNERLASSFFNKSIKLVNLMLKTISSKFSFIYFIYIVMFTLILYNYIQIIYLKHELNELQLKLKHDSIMLGEPDDFAEGLVKKVILIEFNQGYKLMIMLFILLKT